MNIPLGSNITIKTHEEGQIYILITGVISLCCLLFSGFSGISVFFIALTGAVTSFFRDPDRVLPQDKDVVISPGDGTIVAIDNTPIPSEVVHHGLNTEYIKISIFLSVFNVHVNRIPVSGKIVDAKYHPGKFLNASLDKASKDNERNTIAIETNAGDIIYCTQIAGLIARRIICDAYVGDLYAVGDRYGIIKFGSRIDVYLPKKYKLNVSVGQTMVGGETVIAKIAS